MRLVSWRFFSGLMHSKISWTSWSDFSGNNDYRSLQQPEFSVQFGNSVPTLIYKNLIGNLRVILNLKEKNYFRPENFLIHFYNFNGFFCFFVPIQNRLAISPLNSRKERLFLYCKRSKHMINPRFIINPSKFTLCSRVSSSFYNPLGRFWQAK